MLKVENLHKSYGKKEVVKGISFTVQDGEICGFIGHNGAGKTTTLKAIVGIHDYDEGTILVNQYDMKKQPLEGKKIMAFLPDNPDLYDYLTGIKYLNFIGDVFEVDAAFRESFIKDFAMELDLYDQLGDTISSYSHGMKQKLALIGAFLHNPRVLILDEPFVGLDPKATYILKQKMRELCDQGGCVFFSSHVLEVVEKLCDKVIILKEGTIVTAGKTEEVVQGQSLEDLFLEQESL